MMPIAGAWLLGFAVVADIQAASPVLARLDASPEVLASGLPLYAYLSDRRGQDYVLAWAPPSELNEAGLPWFQIAAGVPMEDILLAYPRRRSAAVPAGVLFDDGRRYILLAPGPEAVERLANDGFAVRRLRTTPLRWPVPSSVPEPAVSIRALTPDSRVGEIIQAVSATNLYRMLSQLTGDDLVAPFGRATNITTRSTQSGAPVTNSAQTALNRLNALGFAVSRQGWSAPYCANQNIIAQQPGGALSNEIVIVLAHLDNMPSSGRAPGADDNGTGSAAVLELAGIFSGYRFDRTIRYVLVTGEEQGLYGSDAYAAAVAAAGANVVGVLTMDMIGWNSDSSPRMELHTRTSGAPGYAGDRALAALFTNVVASYGLSAQITPLILADGVEYSDHWSFWDHGFSAILAIEDDADFTPYYHSVNDALTTINVGYFTALTKAMAGTLAHLAGPTGRSDVDVVQLSMGGWQAGSTLGIGTFVARHQASATEATPDGLDQAWTNPAAFPAGIRIASMPYATALAADVRPTASASLFSGALSAVTAPGATLGGTNRLQVSFLAPPASNRIYTLRIHVDAAHTSPTGGADVVCNLRDVVSAGGYVDLPSLGGVSNGVTFGTFDLGGRFIDQQTQNCAFAGMYVTGGVLRFQGRAQAGTRVVDLIESASNLMGAVVWRPLASITNNAMPDAAGFTSEWVVLPDYQVNTSSSNAAYLRFSRRWLGW